MTVASAPPNQSARSRLVSPNAEGFYLVPGAIEITAGVDGARIRIEYLPPVEKRH